jgi:hypothetical protein
VIAASLRSTAAGAILSADAAKKVAYLSQSRARHQPPLCRAFAIQMRLGGEPGLDHEFPEKPKGMHWRTYERLYGRFYDYVRETHQLASPLLVQVINRLNR